MSIWRFSACFFLAALPVTFSLQAQVQPQKPDKAYYVPHKEDAALKELGERDKNVQDEANARTEAIVKDQEALAKREDEEKKDLRFDMKGIARPAGPEAFKTQAWHLPPVPQYETGACWVFSTTSFYESEVQRLTGQKIKLSEMWTDWHEYLEKAKRYVQTRGHSVFEDGSEAEAVPRIWSEYGVVPEEAFPGVVVADKRHDHTAMVQEMKDYLAYCKAQNYWNEAQILDVLRGIMRKTMGDPPAQVAWQGKSYTPQEFLRQVLRIHPEEYVSFMSTEQVPFWTQGEFKAEDNWCHDKSYFNVPLDTWYALLVSAVKAGSTSTIGGDVSEPGYDGGEKIAVIPEFDIPPELIDQDARELRIESGATQDDHGVHLVGYLRLGGSDWFLIKDSARESWKARPEGYLYYRGDYVRLKMLTFTVHRSFANEVLARFGK